MLKILHQEAGLAIAQSFCADTNAADRIEKASDFGFNLGLHVGDDPGRVLQNRARFLRLLRQVAPTDAVFWLNQTHSDKAVPARLCAFAPDADALFSTQNAALAIMTADCVPVALWTKDETGVGAIACVHAGWQGLANGVIAHAAAKLGAASGGLYAYIGAHIGAANYEVDAALVDRITQACIQNGWVERDQSAGSDQNAARRLRQDVAVDGKNGKARLDLGRLAALQLQKAGAQLVGKGECTYAGSYFSHRRATHRARAGARTGRMAMAVIKYAN